jgi:mono/diheme cytochrome c family protein
MLKTLVIFLMICFCCGFVFLRGAGPGQPMPIPASPQRTGGNAKAGYDYLVSGNYVKGGIPMSIFKIAVDKSKLFIERSGLNKELPHDYTAFEAANGEVLVAPNCLQCHAQVFDGQLYIGLGNTFADFTPSKKYNEANAERLSKLLKTMYPKKYGAAAMFLKISKTVGPLLNTEVRGVNPAGRLAAVLAAHRDPLTFRWLDSATMDIPNAVIPTDVPPWWLLKKKHAMFYTGVGRGDFGRFLMTSNLLTAADTSEAAEVDGHMPHLLAYLNSLQPPAYPHNINTSLAATGRQLFIQNCSRCHGTYDKEAAAYPNLLIPGSVIQTDSLLYKANYASPQFSNWFNNSWFTLGSHPARLVPFAGYVAPPLDGIWITAPYLHNGSVPNLDVLLNSKTRPVYWSRNFDKPEYDYEKIGWQYTISAVTQGATVYNTTLPGYGNSGHYFGDVLSGAQRKAVIEYLKTL